MFKKEIILNILFFRMGSVFYNKKPLAAVESMDSYLMQKPPDCSFFTEDGYEIPVHKELLCQTDLMCDIVRNSDCCKIEMIFSSLLREELELMVEFLYKGQISCSDNTFADQVIANLQELLGFPKYMGIITDQPYEDVLPKVEINEPFETDNEFMTNSKEWLMDFDHDIPESLSKEVKESTNESKKDLVSCEYCLGTYSAKFLKKHKRFYCKQKPRKENIIFGEKTLIQGSEEKESKECDVCNQKSSKVSKHITEARPIERGRKANKDNLLICGCKPLTCPVCNGNYTNRKSWTIHLKSQHNWSTEAIKELKYKCQSCDIEFWKKSELEYHIANIHNKTYDCSICGKVYRSRSALKIHTNYEHEGKKKLKCSMCEKEYLTQKSLDYHISVVHEGKRPYLCSRCAFAAPDNSGLKKHIEAVHEGKRPYTCHICGMGCKQRSQLISHIGAVHEKKKPFKCTLCDRSFFNRAHLMKHQDVHENVRPHSCHICDAKFKRKHHLGTHLKTIHGSAKDKDVESTK